MPASPVQLRGIVTHWSAGHSHHASDLDREHYHICIEGDGRLVRGEKSILANLKTSDGHYAAHCRGFNTKTIGVSVMCMGGAIESPRYFGTHPMTREQWDAMLLVCADLSERYQIPVTPTTILGHGEVERTLGIDQNGKWDPLCLPWAPKLSRREVADLMREGIRSALKGRLSLPTETRTPIGATVFGARLQPEGFLHGGNSYLPLRPAMDVLSLRFPGAEITALTADRATVRHPKWGEHLMPFLNHGGRGFVPAKLLASAFELACDWDAPARTVRLHERQP